MSRFPIAMGRVRRPALIAAIVFGGAAPASHAAVDFPVSFDASANELNETDRAYLTSHFEEAGRRWTALLDLPLSSSIEIEIALDANIAFATGFSVTSALVETVNGREVYEQGAAHELRTGVDPNAAAADVRIVLNPDYLRDELWFDPQPASRQFPVPQDRTDAMSMALHELGHALAYSGWANGQGVPPPTYWSTFDRHIEAGAPSHFIGEHVLATWGSAPELTTGNIHHWANAAVVPRKRAAAFVPWIDAAPVPPACEGVPSADRAAFEAALQAKGNLPPGLLYELMNGVVFYRGSRYDISALDAAVLVDAGLPVRTVFADGFESD